jgi:hypothetical protein
VFSKFSHWDCEFLHGAIKRLVNLGVIDNVRLVRRGGVHGWQYEAPLKD